MLDDLRRWRALLWIKLRKFRTWVFNLAALFVTVLPEFAAELLGYNWALVVPPKYMPWVMLFIIVGNVMMRPRPARLPEELRRK